MIEILTVKNLTMRFGGLVAVDNVSFLVLSDMITSVIGPNGAGKTTLFNCITGFYKPTSGHISTHDGEREIRIERLRGDDIVRRGKIARTFQNIRLFGAMTVFENLLVAQHSCLMAASGFCIKGLLGMPSYRAAERLAIEKAKFWLNMVGLTDSANFPAQSLPYGSQRRLEIARAMCLSPKVICLDEPAAGLNPRETDELNALLIDICRKHETTVLLIEHDMRVVMQISDHIIVLDHGKKIAEGSALAIQHNPHVIRAYLGDDDA